MSDVKQVIVVRNDLHMHKGKLAALAAQASMQFLTDNNEADRGDEMVVKLSPAEVTWLSGSSTTMVVGIDSEDALADLVLRAELQGIEVHPVTEDSETDLECGIQTLTCAAFGPCDADLLDKITGNLKLIH